MENNTTGNQSTSMVPEPAASLVIRLILSALTFVMTVVGNSMVIMVIMKNRKLRSLETYYYGYYLLNLAIADLSVALLVIPFTLIYNETGSWPFGVFLCKVVPTLLVGALNASILTLLVLTFERYWAIVYPFRPRLTRNKLLIILALVWICSFAAAAPELFVFDLKETDSSKIQEMYPCREVWATQKQRQAYTVFLFVFGYLLPLFLILAAYVRIVVELRSTTTQCFGSAHEKDHIKKTVRVLIVVVASFALCFLPEKVLFLWIDYGDGWRHPYINIFVKYSYIFSWLNSCLNPIIYGAVDINFRTFYRSLLRQCAGCKDYSDHIKRRLSTVPKSTSHHKQGEYELTTGTVETGKILTGGACDPDESEMIL